MRISTPASRVKLKPKLSYFDLSWMFLSPLFALIIRGKEFIAWEGFPWALPTTYEYAFITFVTSIPIFLFFRVNEGISYLFSVKDLQSIISATLCSVAASNFIVFTITRLDGIPRTVPIIYGFVLIFGFFFHRVFGRMYFEYKSKLVPDFHTMRLTNQIRNVIIIGIDNFAKCAIRLIDVQNPRSTQVVAAFSPSMSHSGRRLAGVKILHDLSTIKSIVDEYQIHGVFIHELWVADSVYPMSDHLIEFLDTIYSERGIRYKKLSEALGLIELDPVDDGNFQSLDSYYKVPDNSYLSKKRIIDFLLIPPIAIFLVMIFPFLFCLVLYDVGAPIFFWQQRSGWYGKGFMLYKFRTLKFPIDVSGNILSDQQRMSLIGAFLRKTRLDELPQLLSVITGDMSLIGPRPLLPRDEPADNRIRLSIRPGLTGWAQVNGNNLLTPEERNALDCWYISNASFILDLQILIKTLHAVIFGVQRCEENIEAAMVAMVK